MKKFPNFDLEEYLNNLNIFFRKHEGDHLEYSICCPDCENNGKTKDEEFKAWINAETGSYCCYRCDSSGSIVRLIQKIEHIPKMTAIKKLLGKISSLEYLSYQLYNDSYFFDEEEDFIREISLPYGFVGFDEAKKRNIFHEYLLKRGISIKYALKNEWGFCKTGYLANRIIVPMFIDNKLVFWQARDVLEEKHPNWGNKKLYKKTLNPQGVSARHVLYNYDVAKNFDEIILVEGFVDAVKAGKNSVAANGKNLHSKQVELLTQTKAKKIILLFDPDAFENGRKNKSSAQKAKDQLQSFFDVAEIRLPRGRDAGSYNHNSLQRIIANRLKNQ